MVIPANNFRLVSVCMDNARPVQAPSDLPKVDSSLISFDMRQKKRHIFEEIRERIRTKAQYTKSGRMPWTQITAYLPVADYIDDTENGGISDNGNDITNNENNIRTGHRQTNDEEDLAVAWAFMERCTTRGYFNINDNGDHSWTMYGDDMIGWLLGNGIEMSDGETEREPEWKNLPPMEKYVHPVLFETGARKKTLLENKLKRARARGAYAEVCHLEEQLSSLPEAASLTATARPKGHDYHWAGYNECIVTFKKKQTRKVKYKELQLTIKVRTHYLGSGDPNENNGYLGSSSNVELMDPESRLFKLLAQIGK